MQVSGKYPFIYESCAPQRGHTVLQAIPSDLPLVVSGRKGFYQLPAPGRLILALPGIPKGGQDTREGKVEQQERAGGEAACPPPDSSGEIRLDEVLRTIPSKTLSIDDSLTLKDGNLFFLCKTFGDVPLAEESAEGLYYHDCRFLDGYELRVAGRSMETLVSTSGRGYEALIELTNPDLYREDGRLFARSEEIGVKWTRRLDEETLSLNDEIALRNFGPRTLTVPLSLAFKAGFHDIFAVRSLLFQERGTLHPSEWTHGCLYYRYDGCDSMVRRMWVCPHTQPHLVDNDRLVFEVTLGPREEKRLDLSVSIAEDEEGAAAGASAAEPQSQAAVAGADGHAGGDDEPSPGARDGWIPALPDVDRLHARHRRAFETRSKGMATIKSSSLLVDRVIDRSRRDLHMLRSSLEGEEYYSAGVPWFSTLFGRDSIIAALHMLPFDPSVAKQTLRILAKYQGKEHDAWREEQPGKIMHEIRVGELARTGAVPHSPYFGTVDATPLFIILAGRHHAWTGDDEFFEELRPAIQAASDWMRADERATGYITYESTSGHGLTNQGWKDSEDGIQNRDGSLAKPPIALVEVQAYAYRARIELADLYLRTGEARQGAFLRQEALELKRRFNRDFWMDDASCYALALTGDGDQAAVCSSNAGHALWAGVADAEKAREVRRRLMKADMFSGWGVRTLAESEIGYSPIGYHVGTVWPHDNSFILRGFRRYGYDGPALRLFEGMFQAATHFDLYRLPELFAGFSRREYEVPVHYPLANKPQAWAAGTIPDMLAGLLGLRPDAVESRLRVVRPLLPDFISWVELNGLHIGNNSVDLRFVRTPSGVAVEVRHKDKSLDIVVEL